MNLLVFLVLLVMGFEAECQTVGGFGYELLIGKMELLEQKLERFQNDSIQNHEDRYQRENMERHRQEKLLNETIRQDKQRQTELLEQNSKILEILKKIYNRVVPIASCGEANESGRYKMKVSHQTLEVYCEQQLYGGGWIVIQNRFDGTVDFYRNWTEYRNGFGSLNGEFWLGLQAIHLLTSSRNFELMVHLEDFDGVVKYAKYEKFAVGSENEQYVLKTAESYSGTAGDSLRPKGIKFSTYDRDNDNHSGKCTQERKGAWWYNICGYGNLNGKHQNAKYGIYWYDFREWHGLKVSKMMIREA